MTKYPGMRWVPPSALWKSEDRIISIWNPKGIRKKGTRYNLFFPSKLLKEIGVKGVRWGSLQQPHSSVATSLKCGFLGELLTGASIAFLAFHIDRNLSLHSCYLQNLLLLWGLCHPAQSIRPSVLGPWPLNKWHSRGRNDGGEGLSLRLMPYSMFSL